MSLKGSDSIDRKKRIANGLVNVNKAAMVEKEFEDDDDLSDTEEEKRKPLCTNSGWNISMAIMNIMFAILLIISLTAPGADQNWKIFTIIVIAVLMAVCASSGLIYYFTCHWEPDQFQDAVYRLVEEKRKNDPEFAKKMARGYLVPEKRYIDDLDAYVKRAFELEQEDGALSSLLQSSKAESEPGAEAKRINEIQPSPGPSVASRDPTLAGRVQVEMSAIKKDSRLKEITPAKTSTDSSAKKGILKKESTPRRQKSVTWSVANKDHLFKNPADAEEFQSFKDHADPEDKDGEPGNVYGGDVDLDDEDIVDEPGEIDEEPSEEIVEDEKAPPDFYNVLFSASHLKVTFRKYKKAVQKKCPDGFQLENLDEKDLKSIIGSRPARKRILVTAKKLIIELKEESARQRRTQADDDEDEEFGDNFLSSPGDHDSEEE